MMVLHSLPFCMVVLEGSWHPTSPALLSPIQSKSYFFSMPNSEEELLPICPFDNQWGALVLFLYDQSANCWSPHSIVVVAIYVHLFTYMSLPPPALRLVSTSGRKGK